LGDRVGSHGSLSTRTGRREGRWGSARTWRRRRTKGTRPPERLGGPPRGSARPAQQEAAGAASRLVPCGAPPLARLRPVVLGSHLDCPQQRLRLGPAEPYVSVRRTP
jgi:hypothetical protein